MGGSGISFGKHIYSSKFERLCNGLGSANRFVPVLAEVIPVQKVCLLERGERLVRGLGLWVSWILGCSDFGFSITLCCISAKQNAVENGLSIATATSGETPLKFQIELCWCKTERLDTDQIRTLILAILNSETSFIRNLKSKPRSINKNKTSA